MSYVAVYWSTDGNTLIGGVLKSQSSRFQHKADAELRLAGVMDLNGPHCEGRIVESDLPPEIFVHCGDIPQSIGGRCFGCGKMLTEDDAKMV